MALAKVLSFIHSKIASISSELENNLQKFINESKHNEIVNGNNYLLLLCQIRNLIEDSNLGSNLKKVTEAIKLIEQVPFKYSNGEKEYFWEILYSNDYTVFKNLKDTARLEPLIHTPACEYLLGRIHLTLIQYFQYALKLQSKWRTSTQNDHEIINDKAIVNWQQKQKEVTNSGKSLDDFRRGITFGVEFMKNNQNMQKPAYELSDIELAEMLWRFVSSADAYTESEKRLIFNWLKCNGGQENSRFIDNLLEECYFTPASFTPGKSQPNEQHWYISRGGKICFNYDVSYLSLQQGHGLTLFMSLPKKTEHRPLQAKDRDYGCYAETPEPLYAIKEKNRKPVLRVNTNIQLEIAHNEVKCVTPEVTHFQADVFTELLCPIQQSVPSLKKA